MRNDKIKGWIYVLIQLLLILLIFAACYREVENIGDRGSALSLIGLLIAILGFVMMAISFFSFRQIMTPNPVPLDSSTLATTGIYRFVRHPMYSSVLLSLIGVVMYFKSVSALIVWLIAVVFILYKIRFEEFHLKTKFPDYEKYSMSTKKLIPFIY